MHTQYPNYKYNKSTSFNQNMNKESKKEERETEIKRNTLFRRVHLVALTNLGRA